MQHNGQCHSVTYDNKHTETPASATCLHYSTFIVKLEHEKQPHGG